MDKKRSYLNKAALQKRKKYVLVWALVRLRSQRYMAVYLLRSRKAVYLVEKKYGTAKRTVGSLVLYGNCWSVDAPARQLKISLRLVKYRPDVVDAHSRCVEFPKNRVRAFGD